MGGVTWEQLRAAPVPREEVPLPELGGSVWVRGMTGTERDKFEALALMMRSGTDPKAAEKAYDNYKARVLAPCIQDEGGRPLVPQGAASQLGDMPSVLVSRLFDVCLRLSGLGADAADDALKNSESVPAGAFSSISPES